jgi:hypothetical protein
MKEFGVISNITYHSRVPDPQFDVKARGVGEITDKGEATHAEEEHVNTEERDDVTGSTLKKKTKENNIKKKRTTILQIQYISLVDLV